MWNPHKIKQIEYVERFALRMASNSLQGKTVSVSCSIVHGLSCFPDGLIASEHLKHNSKRNIQQHLLHQQFARTNAYHNFIPCTVHSWNSLPEPVPVILSQLHEFKSLVVHYFIILNSFWGTLR